MSDKYNKIFTNDIGNVPINPDVVYMIIPSSYVCVYHKLLVMLSDFGYQMLNDCNAGCKGNNKNILSCWNMFQAACAAYQLEETKKADILIKYIKAQITNIYKGTGIQELVGNITLPITEDGELVAIINCGDSPTFNVDEETAELYANYKEGVQYNEVYSLDDKDIESK